MSYPTGKESISEMSILLFSDLHCHNFEQFSEKLPSGRNSRFQDCLNVVFQAREICIEKQVDTCVFLGDVFESRTKLDIDVLTGTYEAFRSLSGSVDLIMVKGNHDAYTKVGDVYSTKIFSEFAKVVEGPGIWRLGNKASWNVAIYPWTSDIEGMKEWIKQMPPCDLFLFHQGLSEAAVGPFDMHVKTEVSIKDLPLDKTRYCIAGDFHKRQFLANGKFHYLGSPLQLSFGEREDNKCFTLIHDDWSIESIPTNAPRFYLFENADAYEKEKDKIGPKDFVKVLDTNRIKLEQIKATSPRIQTVLEKQGDIKNEKRVSSEVLKNDVELLRTWVTRANTELDPDLLVEEGAALIRGSD